MYEEARVRYTLCKEPYGIKVRCKYAWISHRIVNTGSMLTIESSNFLKKT
jgi:hypothetical protein